MLHSPSGLLTALLLQDLNTFGFRGEALSSLCAMAELSVITRQADQAAGVRLEYDTKGNLQHSNAAARSTGTTVSVKDIFKPLPVRYKVADSSCRELEGDKVEVF